MTPPPDSSSPPQIPIQRRVHLPGLPCCSILLRPYRWRHPSLWGPQLSRAAVQGAPLRPRWHALLLFLPQGWRIQHAVGNGQPGEECHPSWFSRAQDGMPERHRVTAHVLAQSSTPPCPRPSLRRPLASPPPTPPLPSTLHDSIPSSERVHAASLASAWPHLAFHCAAVIHPCTQRRATSSLTLPRIITLGRRRRAGHGAQEGDVEAFPFL